jgi:hypothetical protein
MAPGSRPRATHVQAALQSTAQAKAAAGPQKLAAHVRAATVQQARPLVAPPPARRPAPHVQAAVAAAAQPHRAAVPPPDRPVARHVRAAVTALAQPKLPERAPRPPGGQVVQRFRDRKTGKTISVRLLSTEEIREYLINRTQHGVSETEFEELYEEYRRRVNQQPGTEDLRRIFHHQASHLMQHPDVESSYQIFRRSGLESGTSEEYPLAPETLEFVVEGPGELLGLHRLFNDDARQYVVNEVNRELQSNNRQPITTFEEALKILEAEKGEDPLRVAKRIISRRIYFGSSDSPTSVTQTIHTKGGRAEQLSALGDYPSILNMINWLKKGAGLSDEEIATLIIQRAQNMRLDIPKSRKRKRALSELTGDVLESVEYYVSQLTLLLLGTESARSIENSLIAPMMLTQVATGELTFAQLFSGASTLEGGSYYASMDNAVSANRSHHLEVSGGETHHYGGPLGSREAFQELRRRLDAQISNTLEHFGLRNRTYQQTSEGLRDFGDLFYTNRGETSDQPDYRALTFRAEAQYASNLLEFMRQALANTPKLDRHTIAWYRLEDVYVRAMKMEGRELVEFLNFFRPAPDKKGLWIRLRGG